VGHRPLSGQSDRRGLAVAVATFALIASWLARWPFRSRHHYEWDSAQYAMGVVDFDIYAHRPHPPGYPVWIALLKLLHVFVDDLVLVQVIVANAVSAIAALVFHGFARRELHSNGLALVATVMVFWSPPAIVASVYGNTYPVDLLASASLGLLSARLWRGDARVAPLAAALLALFAGARQSSAVLLAPLVAIALLRTARLDGKTWLKAGAAGVCVFAAWYVPVARMHGGAAALQTYQADNVRMYFSHMSVLYGAPLRLHLAMLRDVALWTALMLAVPVATTVVAVAVAAIRRRRTSPLEHRQLGALFYALWIAPTELYVTALHCPKPGYLLVALPPAALLLTRAVARASLSPIAACVVAAVVAILGTALGRGFDSPGRTPRSDFRRRTPRRSRLRAGSCVSGASRSEPDGRTTSPASRARRGLARRRPIGRRGSCARSAPRACPEKRGRSSAAARCVDSAPSRCA